MAVYDIAIKTIAADNNIRSSSAFDTYSETAKNDDCASTSSYFKVVEYLKKNGVESKCLFKTADGMYWDITNTQRPKISVNKNEIGNTNAKTTFVMSARLDKQGVWRINDIAYEETLEDGVSGSLAKLFNYYEKTDKYVGINGELANINEDTNPQNNNSNNENNNSENQGNNENQNNSTPQGEQGSSNNDNNSTPANDNNNNDNSSSSGGENSETDLNEPVSDLPDQNEPNNPDNSNVSGGNEVNPGGNSSNDDNGVVIPGSAIVFYGLSEVFLLSYDDMSFDIELSFAGFSELYDISINEIDLYPEASGELDLAVLCNFMTENFANLFYVSNDEEVNISFSEFMFNLLDFYDEDGLEDFIIMPEEEIGELFDYEFVNPYIPFIDLYLTDGSSYSFAERYDGLIYERTYNGVIYEPSLEYVDAPVSINITTDTLKGIDNISDYKIFIFNPETHHFYLVPIDPETFNPEDGSINNLELPTLGLMAIVYKED